MIAFLNKLLPCLKIEWTKWINILENVTFFWLKWESWGLSMNALFSCEALSLFHSIIVANAMIRQYFDYFLCGIIMSWIRHNKLNWKWQHSMLMDVNINYPIAYFWSFLTTGELHPAQSILSGLWALVKGVSKDFLWLEVVTKNIKTNGVGSLHVLRYWASKSGQVW